MFCSCIRVIYLASAIVYSGAAAANAADLLTGASSEAVTLKTRSLILADQQGALLSTPINDGVFDFDDEIGISVLSTLVDGVGESLERCALPSGPGLAAAYDSVLSSAIWSKNRLTSEDRTNLSAARSLLYVDGFNPTPQYGNFLKLRKVRDEAKASLESTPVSQRTATQINALTQAEENLRILSEPHKYLAAEQTFKRLMQRTTNLAPAIYRTNWPMDGAEAARRKVVFAPPLNTLYAESDWVALNMTTSDLALPGWLGQALRVRLKVKRVRVQRSWLSEDLFADNSWRSAQAVSDGRGNGPLGRAISTLFFIKDFTLWVEDVKAARRAIVKTLDLAEVVKLGPFELAYRGRERIPFVPL